MTKHFDLSLYLVLDVAACGRAALVDTALAAVRGGATLVQLRDKTASHAALIASGTALVRALAGIGVPLIVNDDVEAAIACGAAGAHVGQGDLSPAMARARLGPDRILGLSVETVAQAAAADPALVDYVGISPVFGTGTKPDHAPPLGLQGLAAATAATRLPAVAIGGLAAEHAAAVLGAGAAGMAVVSAICGQPDPEAATRRLAEALAAARLRSAP